MTPPSPSDLLHWRENQGLSQKKAAALLPVSERTWQHWEAGTRKPPAYLGRALRDLERELSIRRSLDTTRPV